MGPAGLEPTLSPIKSRVFYQLNYKPTHPSILSMSALKRSRSIRTVVRASTDGKANFRNLRQRTEPFDLRTNVLPQASRWQGHPDSNRRCGSQSPVNLTAILYPEMAGGVGIEPTTVCFGGRLAGQGTWTPTFRWNREESNLRPTACTAAALPTELRPHGRDSRTRTCMSRINSALPYRLAISLNMMLSSGLEPLASRLSAGRSNLSELRQHMAAPRGFEPLTTSALTTLVYGRDDRI